MSGIGSRMAGLGTLFGLLCYFLGIRGGIRTIPVKTWVVISIVCLIVGFVLMRVGLRAKKRSTGTLDRRAIFVEEAGSWPVAPGSALVALFYLFGA